MIKPVVHELSKTLPVDAFRRLSRLPHCVFFDCVDASEPLGRYSYVAADPYKWLTADELSVDQLESLSAALAAADPCELTEGLPPFQGGAAGVIAYEYGRHLERTPAARFDEFQAPSLAVGLYDAVVAFDHQTDEAWIVSTGMPERGAEARRRRAESRRDSLLDVLRPGLPLVDRGPDDRIQLLAPQSEVAGLPGVTSDFSRPEYLDAVRRAVEYIHAGDLFQVNLSQRLVARQTEPAEAVYLRLRERNPAPFAGYADLGETQVCSASPERFLSVRDGRVETRPIKGTRPRSSEPARDAQLAEELVTHPKDRAENVMIVDLLRNDLSKVCTPESVRVPMLCGLESYRHVHHLVSVVEGELAPGRTAIDLVHAAFPGGSITGAPKVRAMEIIAELEPTARGPYCGSMFWAGFNGAMDSSILIRTAICGGGWVQTPVGGGIVADSDPATEYEETLHKARGLVEG